MAAPRNNPAHWPERIGKPRQLLVEGDNACHFFRHALEQLGIQDVEIRDGRSIQQMGHRLDALTKMPGFWDQVESLGIVRDAETSVKSAFESVQTFIRKVGTGGALSLPVPRQMSQAAEGSPRVSVYILPNCRDAGMLENLCLDAVSETPEFECVSKLLECIKATGRSVRNESKMLFYCYVATRETPAITHGLALKAGALNFESPTYVPLKEFLRGF